MRGAGLVEYGLVVAVIALGGIVALRDTGENSSVEIEYVAAVIDGEVLDSDGAGFGGTSAGNQDTGGASGGSSSGTSSRSVDGSSAANQSFEDGQDNFFIIYNEGDSIGIWDVVEGSVDPFRVAQPTLAARWINTGATAPDGEKVLDLNGREAGAIETELRVAKEADYTLTFLASENHFCTGSTVADGVARTGAVRWNGEVVGNFSVDTDFGEFDVVTVNLPASSSTTGTLRIESTMAGSCGPAIESASMKVALRP